MNQTLKASLYYREGKSDKVYECGVDPLDGGFVVSFAYGRRGGTLKAGLKTPQAVSYDEAVRVFDSLVAEKVGKGYVAGEDAPSYTPAPKEVSRTLPGAQLLNAVDESEVQRYVADYHWGSQPKLDGKRIMISANGGKLDVRQKQGKPCGIAKFFHTLLQSSGDFMIDGEMVGETFHVFDLLRLGGMDLCSLSYASRHAALALWLQSFNHPSLVLVPLAVTTFDKAQMVIELVQARAEGVVFKRLAAPHSAGRPNSGGDQVKIKFVATLTARVSAEPTGKRSVYVEVFKPSGEWINLGSVTIPPNREIPVAGALVEVRYLYAYPTGSIIQAVYLGERDDVDEADCSITQLKYKQGLGEED